MKIYCGMPAILGVLESVNFSSALRNKNVSMYRCISFWSYLFVVLINRLNAITPPFRDQWISHLLWDQCRTLGHPIIRSTVQITPPPTRRLRDSTTLHKVRIQFLSPDKGWCLMASQALTWRRMRKTTMSSWWVAVPPPQWPLPLPLRQVFRPKPASVAFRLPSLIKRRRYRRRISLKKKLSPWRINFHRMCKKTNVFVSVRTSYHHIYVLICICLHTVCT